MKEYIVNGKNRAFTLAETLIVIAVLGIVAMLTVPNVIKQHMEAVARTKIKKSMTVYDMAITKMTVENDLRSDTELINWADNAEKNDCANTSAYFKAKSCKFKTADGVWWYIDKIMNPIIALSEKDLDDAIDSGINGKTSFKLVASFDRQSGAFRVDDLGYEKLKLAAQLALAPEEQPEDVQENIEELELLFGFINDKKDKNGGSEEVCEVTRSCSYGECSEIDCHGRETAYYGDCDNNGENCEWSQISKYDDKGRLFLYGLGCGGNGNYCASYFVNKYDENDNVVSTSDCDENGNNCFYSSIFEYDDNGNMTVEYWGCDGNGIRCYGCYDYGSSCRPKNSHGYYDPEDTVYDD